MTAPAPETIERELYTVVEWCRCYSRSRATLYRLLAIGKLAAVKDGTSTLITGESTREWRAGLPAFLPTALPTPTPEIVSNGQRQHETSKRRKGPHHQRFGATP